MLPREKDELGRLMERVAAIAESPENQARAAHWKRYLAGTPSNRDPEGPLYTLDVGIPTWSRILGFGVVDYFTDTYTHLRCQLLIRLYHHDHFPDDTVVGKGLGVSPLGAVLECSMLGAEIAYRPDTNPWAAHDRPIVSTDDDLDRLQMPDFYRSGAMPLAHRMYAEARELVQQLGFADWRVSFPAAVRGVLGLAQVMRGPHENVLVDMLERPDFARRLFRFAADFRKHYARERARFLGEPVGKGHIGNDEVTIPIISPRLYEEFLLPLEIEISEFHGGLSCWHSCGDTGKLAPLIRKIPDVAQFYTGPWTDLGAVMSAFGTDTPLDVAIHVVDDMLAATPEQMEAKIRKVMAACDGAALKLRAGSTDSVFELQADMAKARLWCEVARRVARS